MGTTTNYGMTTMKYSTRCLLIALLALGWHARALAQAVGQGASASAVPTSQTGYIDLLAGLTYTDNALLAGGQRQGDGIGAAGINVDYARHSELSLDLLGNVERLEYLRRSFAGSFYGHFYGSAILGKATDPLQWQLRDSFGEGTTDPLAAPTPVHLQTINDVATGPIVNLHFGLANRLTLFGLYSRTTYQRSPYDSQAYQGGTEFVHRLSGASSLALQASTERIEYIDRAAAQSYGGGIIANYAIRQASGAYEANFARIHVRLRAGYNQLDYGAGARHGAPLYAVSVSRTVSPFSTVFLSGQSAYSTNGNSMGSPNNQISLQAGASVSPGYAVAQPVYERSGAVGWTFQRARSHVSLIGTIRQDIYQQAAATNGYNGSYGNYGNYGNHRNEGVVAILGRQLRPTVALQLRAQGYVERYTNLNARTQWESVGFTLSKHFARLAASLYAERRHQSGSPGASTFLAASYNDDRVGLYFTYDLFGQRPMDSFLGAMPGMAGSMGGSSLQ